ncbi:hypothetical protein NFI96_000298 [Prochilodus magdalenae]|nr:hypothetical protein NFI96_000298 [Prochilodus magdalenae]
MYLVGVRQSTLPTTSKDQALAQVEDSDAFSKPTPKKVRRKPQVVFHQNKGRGLPSAGGGNVTRSRLSSEDIHLQLDRLGLEEGEKITRELLHPPGGHGLTSLTGEITGTRVTADYHCSGCSSAISSFKAKAFRVKCTRCRHSWKCAKLRCTCTAEITIELSDRSKRTVVLSDPLLRSIVSFEMEGHCNTDTIEDRVLKVGSIRVDYVDGVPERVERITADRVRA